MSARRMRKRNLRARAVRALACKWDAKLGRDRGCHSNRFTYRCEVHEPPATVSYLGRDA